MPQLRAALCAGLLSASGVAGAWQDSAIGVYGAIGRTWRSDGGTHAPSVGLIVPWQRWTPWTPGAGTSWYLDFILSQWRAALRRHQVAQSGRGFPAAALRLAFLIGLIGLQPAG